MTGDGSHSIEVPELNACYHSIHGAIQESKHVFIQAGLIDSGVFDYVGVHKVLEIGFGTGLNALLTLIEADKHANRIYYTGIELDPLNETEVNQLNYCEQLGLPQYQSLFEKMHQCEWNEMVEITNYFRLTKIKTDLKGFSTENVFFLIYFDAFAPTAQPELWTREVFDKMHSLLLPEGILVTYCSKGGVRRALQAAGFKVEKLHGPKGKREMIKATKMTSSPAE
jgi:tRNA U34 5-methylaminomethyl-2-thiouridine-forming methyltransferase MnmC